MDFLLLTGCRTGKTARSLRVRRFIAGRVLGRDGRTLRRRLVSETFFFEDVISLFLFAGRINPCYATDWTIIYRLARASNRLNGWTHRLLVRKLSTSRKRFHPVFVRSSFDPKRYKKPSLSSFQLVSRMKVDIRHIPAKLLRESQQTTFFFDFPSAGSFFIFPFSPSVRFTKNWNSVFICFFLGGHPS